MSDSTEELLSWAEIHLDKLKNNFFAVKHRLQPGTKVIAVIKADAYGHGAVRVASALADCAVDGFAVSSAAEAIELRGAGILAPILILGYTPPEWAETVLKYDLTATVCNAKLAAALAEKAELKQQKARIHIKVDTGFGSDGVPDGQCLAFVQKLLSNKWLEIEGVFTHLVSAYGQDEELLRNQLARFDQLISGFTAHSVAIPLIHAASSPAIMNVPETHYDLVRLGIVLYGLTVPNSELGPEFKPVMQLKAKITGIKTIEPGHTLGYGRTYPVESNKRIASVPLGYADGFFFLLLKNGEVLVHGKRAPIWGQPRMDHFLVDVTDIPEASVGDEIVIFGEQRGAVITAEEVALRSQVGLLNCDAVCLLGKRVPRIYV